MSVTVPSKRIPVRIQVWLDEGTHLDVRAWMDNFDATAELSPGFTKTYVLTAHQDWLDAPWKFSRGKPQR